MPQPDQLTGGCQCGAVRFRAGRLGGAAICHCRMCQKAFGGFFGPLVTGYDVIWTRGEPSWFRSSNRVERGFCRQCGTPLAYRADGEAIELAIGAFDDPTVAAPSGQVNVRDKLGFFDTLTALPVKLPHDPLKADAYKRSIVSHQHPDHDTTTWPPTGGFAA